MTHARLQDALNQINKSNIIIAEDISKTGQKCFRVDTIEHLHAEYSKIKSPHWYECLLEDRPSRIFLDIDSSSPIELENILEPLKTAIIHKFQCQPNIQVLNSCSDKKYSWHIIVTNVWLKNVYHVGAFVRRLVLATHEKSIDTAVYTKNRMFRISGSSKFGSNRVLRCPVPWYTVLVQGWPEKYFECLEIDGSEPTSCCQSPFDLFSKTEHGFVRSVHTTTHHTYKTVCPMLTPIVQQIDKLTDGAVYWHKMAMAKNGNYMISTKSKQCAIAGRCHKGNNIWFMIQPAERRVFQRCYDEECRSRAHEISIDSALWSAWHDEWNVLARTPKNENTLYNMVE